MMMMMMMMMMIITIDQYSKQNVLQYTGISE